MATIAAKPKRSVRPLFPDDLERVIAIDRAHSGHDRRSFYEKRFAAAKSNFEEFVQIGVAEGETLYGFAMARILRGEFGREHAIAVLDGLGVEAGTQDQGVGQTLMSELVRSLRNMGVRSLQSQAEWTNGNLLGFFAGSGFSLAPRFALERSVGEPLAEPAEDV